MQEISNFLTLFSSILWEAMPFIVLGALVAGVLEEFLPQQAITRFLPKQVVLSVMIGGILGIVFPMCECGIVVVMRRLLRKGLPLSCCVAYMLAGPIINLVVIFSTWVAFAPHGIGPEIVGLRVGFGFLTACSVALITHLVYRKHGNNLLTAITQPPTTNATAPPRTSTSDSAHKKSVMTRVSNISATALHDFVDITVFLILGAVLAATVKMQFGNDQIDALSREQPVLAIPGMMLMAFLMCLCSEADAFVAASFTNMHVSSKIAFLVLGPMLDVKLVLMYTRVFRTRLILTIVISTATIVLILCLSLHAFYEFNGWSGTPAGRPS